MRAPDEALGPPTSSEPVVPEIAHFPNGRLKFEGANLDGQMHGPWAWYRTDGSLMRTGAFDRGRQVGTWRTFDRTGRVVKETDFTSPARAGPDPGGVDR